MAIQKGPFVRGYMFECDSKIAGYALLSFTYSNEVGGMMLILEEAYIMPEFQGRGLGSELFRFVEKEYKGKVQRLRLEVTRTNTRAIQLYERMGFTTLEYLQMVKDI